MAGMKTTRWWRDAGFLVIGAVTCLLGCSDDEPQQEKKPFVGVIGSGAATLHVLRDGVEEQTIELSGTLPYFLGSSFGCPATFYSPRLVDSRESPVWDVSPFLLASWLVPPATYSVEASDASPSVADAPFTAPECISPVSISLDVEASPIEGLVGSDFESVSGTVTVDVLSREPRTNIQWSYDVTWHEALDAPGVSLRLVGSAGFRREDETVEYPPDADDFDPLPYDYKNAFCQRELAIAAEHGCVSEHWIPNFGEGGAGGTGDDGAAGDGAGGQGGASP